MENVRTSERKMGREGECNGYTDGHFRVSRAGDDTNWCPSYNETIQDSFGKGATAVSYPYTYCCTAERKRWSWGVDNNKGITTMVAIPSHRLDFLRFQIPLLYHGVLYVFASRPLKCRGGCGVDGVKQGRDCCSL